MREKGHRYYCQAKEGYRKGFLTFLAILFITGLIAYYCITPENVQPGYTYNKGENIMDGIYFFGSIGLLTILLLYNIIIGKLAGVILFDNSIIVKSTKYKKLSDNPDTLSIPYNSNIEIYYQDIKSVKIDESNSDTYNLLIYLKNGNEVYVKDLKKGDILKEELKQKGINKLDFIPKSEEVLKVDPPHI